MLHIKYHGFLRKEKGNLGNIFKRTCFQTVHQHPLYRDLILTFWRTGEMPGNASSEDGVINSLPVCGLIFILGRSHVSLSQLH